MSELTITYEIRLISVSGKRGNQQLGADVRVGTGYGVNPV